MSARTKGLKIVTAPPLKKKYETAAEYLTEPFLEEMESKDLFSKTFEMKILVGITGQGKTYHCANTFIPYLAEKQGIRLAIVSVPTTEILEEGEFSRAVGPLKNWTVTQDADKAVDLLNYDMNVVLLLCHQGFCNGTKGPRMREFLAHSDVPFAIFVDEAHTWLVSGLENYQNVMSHPVAKYDAAMFNAVQELSEKTPFVFGLTATPNLEQNGKYSPVGSMQFRVINDYPPKDLMIGKTAWKSNTEFFNPEDMKHSRYVVLEAYEKAINDLYTRSGLSKIKTTMMTVAGVENCSTGFNLEFVVEQTIGIVKRLGRGVEGEFPIAVMTSKKEETGIHDLEGNFIKKTETEIKRKLKDSNDPLMILVVVNKGSMGMDIFTLKSIVSFKPQNKENPDGILLPEFAVQLLGRAIRFNTGTDKKEFVEQYGYDMEEYVRTLTKQQRCSLVLANQMNFLLPKTEMWEEANRLFSEKYASSVRQAKIWMKALP